MLMPERFIWQTGMCCAFKIMRNNTMHTYEGGDGKEPNLPPVKLSRENVCAMSYLENRTVCIGKCADFHGVRFLRSGPL